MLSMKISTINTIFLTSISKLWWNHENIFENEGDDRFCCIVHCWHLFKKDYIRRWYGCRLWNVGSAEFPVLDGRMLGYGGSNKKYYMCWDKRPVHNSSIQTILISYTISYQYFMAYAIVLRFRPWTFTRGIIIIIIILMMTFVCFFVNSLHEFIACEEDIFRIRFSYNLYVYICNTCI